jgi:hypothetical protein
MSCQSLCSGDSYHIGKQGAPHSDAAGCALRLWGIRRFAPGLMEIQPEQRVNARIPIKHTNVK